MTFYGNFQGKSKTGRKNGSPEHDIQVALTAHIENISTPSPLYSATVGGVRLAMHTAKKGWLSRLRRTRVGPRLIRRNGLPRSTAGGGGQRYARAWKPAYKLWTSILERQKGTNYLAPSLTIQKTNKQLLTTTTNPKVLQLIRVHNCTCTCRISESQCKNAVV